MKPTDLEQRCVELGLKMTEQRRIIARVLTGSSDHPDVEDLHQRAAAIDSGISLATVYRTLRLFEEINLLERHDFRGGRARYEQIPDEHHDHLIDLENGRVIEFQNSKIEAMQRVVAERLGYKLIDHRLELYAVPLNSKKVRKDPKSGG
ncbi:MAG: transcriptional repressor [Alphaproteobacteria bacterium]|nr:transcriptional repressor [Alphaproteobacteria bacterium]